MIGTIEETTSTEHEIVGVVFKPLRSHPDDRGFFRELVRESDPFFTEGFGQWSHSKMAQNTVKAWHYHHLQVDWWYVPFGEAHTVLYDYRKESPTYKKKIEFILGEENGLKTVVRIPPGVLHGCRVLSDIAHLFYITSRTYDPNDEGRLPFDAKEIPHSWGDTKKCIVSENDKCYFEPISPREPLKL